MAASYPVKPNDWRHISELLRDCIASHDLKDTVIKLRQALIDDIMAQGYGKSHAINMVDIFLIGEKRPTEKSARQHSLAVSPEASRLLGLPERREMPGDWITAKALASERNLDYGTLRDRLRSLRQALIGDMGVAGIDEELAGHLVETHLIGTREAEATGWPSISLSPHGVILSEAVGALEKRSPGRPPKKNSGRYGC